MLTALALIRCVISGSGAASDSPCSGPCGFFNILSEIRLFPEMPHLICCTDRNCIWALQLPSPQPGELYQQLHIRNQIVAKSTAVVVEGVTEPIYSSQASHSAVVVSIAAPSPGISGACKQGWCFPSLIALDSTPLLILPKIAALRQNYHAYTQMTIYRPSFSTDAWKDGRWVDGWMHAWMDGWVGG